MKSSKGVISKIICKLATIKFKNRLNSHGKNIHVSRLNTFEGLENVDVGNDFSSGDFLWLAAYSMYNNYKYTPKIVIGNNVKLSRNCHIGAIGEIQIGDNVLFGSNVLVSDHSHGETVLAEIPRVQMPLVSKGAIKIGNNVWIGDNVCILSNVTIGENSVIGANSVVTKDVPPNSLAVGVPAKVIKQLGEKI